MKTSTGKYFIEDVFMEINYRGTSSVKLLIQRLLLENTYQKTSTQQLLIGDYEYRKMTCPKIFSWNFSTVQENLKTTTGTCQFWRLLHMNKNDLSEDFYRNWIFQELHWNDWSDDFYRKITNPRSSSGKGLVRRHL